MKRKRREGGGEKKGRRCEARRGRCGKEDMRKERGEKEWREGGGDKIREEKAKLKIFC
ncbi:MAG: hypothetical protein II951_10045 [Bacteroidales bacterium]|nr:hypothetical protein [Bacteroidales bacterium]